MSGIIDPYEMPRDHRTWNFFWQQVVAQTTVDAILAKVFQGKRDDLREQMLDVAARECRRIEWGPPTDIDRRQREAILKDVRKTLGERRRAEQDS
jgi:hypothetical protein